MIEIIELKTEHLLLRQWRKEDRPGFARINADPDVMQYYPNTLSTEESDAMAQKIESLIAKKGWGFWAVELIDEKSFIGFVGLHEPTYDLPVPPCVEVGWRLAKKYWGKGYATEAAKASLEFAFTELNLFEVYSFPSVSNWKSLAVMKRLGMIDTKKKFEHPEIPQNHPLGEHALYKMSKNHWIENNR